MLIILTRYFDAILATNETYYKWSVITSHQQIIRTAKQLGARMVLLLVE